MKLCVCLCLIRINEVMMMDFCLMYVNLGWIFVCVNEIDRICVVIKSYLTEW